MARTFVVVWVVIILCDDFLMVENARGKFKKEVGRNDEEEAVMMDVEAVEAVKSPTKKNSKKIN